MASMVQEEIDICPFCNSDVYEEQEKFNRTIDTIELTYYAPVIKCTSCKEMWTDYREGNAEVDCIIKHYESRLEKGEDVKAQINYYKGVSVCKFPIKLRKGEFKTQEDAQAEFLDEVERWNNGGTGFERLNLYFGMPQDTFNEFIEQNKLKLI